MKPNQKLIVLILLAFVLRLVLVPVAHHGDLNNNISWGNEAVSRGLIGFYGEDGSSESRNWPYSAPNQPPLYILAFASTGLLNMFVTNIISYLNHSFTIFPSSFVWFWEAHGADFTAKLPGILADLGIAYIIYVYSRRLALSAVWLFNPVTIYSSSIWGQTDSLVNLLGLLAVYFLLRKNLIFSILYFVLGILFKPSLLIFAPILFVVATKQKYSLKIWVQSFALSLATAFLISMLFHPKLDNLIWLFNLYTQTFLPGEIGYLTANAFNLWWLIDPGKTLDSVTYFGIQARIWGTLLALGWLSTILYSLHKKISERKILFALVLTAFTTFLFMTRMHERYLYPIFPSFILLLGFIPSLIIPYLLISILHLLNLYHLFWAPGAPWLQNLYTNPQFIQILALGHLAIFGYLMYKFAKLRN